MRKSLLVTQDFWPAHGGVAKYYSQICRWLPADSISVLAPPLREATELQAGYRIIRRPFLSRTKWLWPRWLPLVRAMTTTARQEHAAVLQVGQVLPVGSAALIAARILRLPYIVYAHGMDIQIPQRSLRKRQTMLKVLRSARLVIANSEYTQRELVRIGVAPERIRKVTPGCDLINVTVDADRLDTLRQCHRLADRFVLLSVSRLEERKGHDMVLAAIPSLLPAIPNLTYLIVGDGPDRVRLEQTARRLGLEDRVVFTGSVSSDELPAYYSTADIFIMPARQLPNRDVEGFGIVYLEANAFGKPVIGGRSGGVSEAVADGQTGLLVNPTDVRDIGQAIRQLWEDPALRQRLGQAGRSRVQQYFQWSQRAELIQKYIEEI